MIIIYEIPIILILTIIAFALGGIYQIANHIFEILLGIIIVAIDIGIFVLLMRIYYKVYEKLKCICFWINVISITFFWFFGILVFFELREIDIQGLESYMAFLNDNEVIRYLILPVAIILLIYMACLLIAYSLKNKILKSLLCITPILLTFLFFYYSSFVCTKSYSDSRLEEFMAMKDIEKQTIKEDAKVYYPVYDYDNEPSLIMGGKTHVSDKSKRVTLFPLFIPIKYSRISFQKGETVFVSKKNKTNYFKTAYYVEASNGKEVGYINVNALE